MEQWATWTTIGIISGPGGVPTVERGTISGELTVHTTWVDGRADITVQYVGAQDWFTFPGSPVSAADEPAAREAHQQAVERVKDGARGQAD